MSHEIQLISFVKALIDANEFGTECFGDLDAPIFEELAIKHGIVKVEIRHAPCSEVGCQCALVYDPEEFEEGAECLRLAEWLQLPAEYVRPELTDEDRKQAEQYASKVFRRYGISKVTVMIAALCLENIRLLKEVNEHRAARGIDPLPTFEV